jgi:YHS domain-containing protein
MGGVGGMTGGADMGVTGLGNNLTGTGFAAANTPSGYGSGYVGAGTAQPANQASAGCQAHVREALTSLKDAHTALNGNDNAKALAKLNEVSNHLTMATAAAQTTVPPMTANAQCPMDQAVVDCCGCPDTQCRNFQGNRVGFGSERSAEQWDTMTDQQRQQKFKSVAPVANDRDPIDGSLLDKANLPDSRTRMVNGMKIGFASEENAQKCDAFTSGQKQDLVDKAMAPSAAAARNNMSMIYNSRDPISGQAVSGTNLAENQTRYFCYNLGFASAANADKWDALNQDQKQQKLDGLAKDHAAAMAGYGSNVDSGVMVLGQKVVNDTDPISGKSIDPAKVSDTRTYQGMKIGFASGDNANAWDNLSEADKQAKCTDLNLMPTTQPNGTGTSMLSPGLSRSYKGQNIGFSSEDSAQSWDRMSDSQKDRTLSGASVGVCAPCGARE